MANSGFRAAKLILASDTSHCCRPFNLLPHFVATDLLLGSSMLLCIYKEQIVISEVSIDVKIDADSTVRFCLKVILHSLFVFCQRDVLLA